MIGPLDHLPGPLEQQLGLHEVVRQSAPEALGLADVDDPALAVEELVRPGRVRNRAGFGPGDHVPIVAAPPNGSEPPVLVAGPGSQYLVGNPLFAVQMTQHDIRPSLYAPLRVLIYENEGRFTNQDEAAFQRLNAGVPA